MKSFLTAVTASNYYDVSLKQLAKKLAKIKFGLAFKWDTDTNVENVQSTATATTRWPQSRRENPV